MVLIRAERQHGCVAELGRVELGEGEFCEEALAEGVGRRLQLQLGADDLVLVDLIEGGKKEEEKM